MQKPTLISSYSLVIQSTYTHIELALFRGTILHTQTILDKKDASAQCIRAIDELLSTSHCTLFDLSYIAVNQGPGPFTTLRVVISTINGISFARHIPLIGINGLEALLAAHQNHPASYRIALLNAFADDLYYGVRSPNGSLVYGYGNVLAYLQHLAADTNTASVLFLGNGALMHRSLIETFFGSRAHFIEHTPLTCSLTDIAALAVNAAHRHELSYQLQPLYFKPAFIPAPS